MELINCFVNWSSACSHLNCVFIKAWFLLNWNVNFRVTKCLFNCLLPIVHNARFFIRSNSTSRFVDFVIPQDNASLALQTISLATANQSQIVAHNIGVAIQTHQRHITDTGTASVQSKRINLCSKGKLKVILFYSFSSLVAVLSERIKNLARHSATHKKDHSSNRGLQVKTTFFGLSLVYILKPIFLITRVR